MFVLRCLCFAFIFGLFSCKSGQQDKNGEDAGSRDQADSPVASIDPIDAPFEEWNAKISATEVGSKERGKILYAIAGDVSLPAYRVLQLIVDHKEGIGRGALIGSYVRIMSRITKSDAVEAARCFELIQDEPLVDALFHSLGGALGRQDPAQGLDWLASREYSRMVYFASANLGTGFAEYVVQHPVSEVEPLFNRFLESSVFEGKSYDQSKGEGSRMRERMADGVLKQLAKSGKLDDELADRLRPNLPLKCVPHLVSYTLYRWKPERILHDFNTDDFPEESRISATLVALEVLMEKSDLYECVRWAEIIRDARSKSVAIGNTFHHFLKSAGDEETLDILANTEDPDQFNEALKWAEYHARAKRNKDLLEQIDQLNKERREAPRAQR